MSATPLGRRAALHLLLGAGAALAAGTLARVPLAHARPVRQTAPHPDPRPGITAAAVLDPAGMPRPARAAYEAAREIPQVLDGLDCHCDCAARDGLRSLLSCFETRMPLTCGYCREEAELALKLHREGRTLAEIREAVDREFGG